MKDSPQFDSVAESGSPEPTKKFLWGDIPMSRNYGTEHFLVAGASGAGKTTLINMLLKSVVESTPQGEVPQIVLYDAKQEMLPIVEKVLGGDRHIYLLHPFDQRCVAWSLSEDIDGPLSAREFATILIPDGTGAGNENSFFIDATRDLLTAVILVFVSCIPNPGTWTFRDVLLAMLYEPYLRFVLQLDRTREKEAFPIVSRVKAAYLDGDARTVSNIRATINARLSVYEPVAACWASPVRDERFDVEEKGAYRNRDSISLKKWVERKTPGVLILGNDEAARSGIDPINQAIFKRISELVLAQVLPDAASVSEDRMQTWIFLDEVREAGRLDGLSRLLTKSRSKRTCIVLGFQDIEGLRDVYGEEVANEICGQCRNVAVLKLNSPGTAQWASDLFGRRIAKASGRGSSTGESGFQVSRDVREDERPYIQTADFLYLPNSGPKTGLLPGFFRSPDIAPEDLRVDLDWRDQVEPNLPGKTSSLPCVAIPPSLHVLRPWDQADWERLGLTKFWHQVLDWAEPATSVPQIVWPGKASIKKRPQ